MIFRNFELSPWMPHWFRTFSSSNKKIHTNTIKIIQASTSSNCNQEQINNKSKSLNSRIETFVSTIINLLKPLQTCLTVTRIREERIEGGDKKRDLCSSSQDKKTPLFLNADWNALYLVLHADKFVSRPRNGVPTRSNRWIRMEFDLNLKNYPFYSRDKGEINRNVPPTSRLGGRDRITRRGPPSSSPIVHFNSRFFVSHWNSNSPSISLL